MLQPLSYIHSYNKHISTSISISNNTILPSVETRNSFCKKITTMKKTNCARQISTLGCFYIRHPRLKFEHPCLKWRWKTWTDWTSSYTHLCCKYTQHFFQYSDPTMFQIYPNLEHFLFFIHPNNIHYLTILLLMHNFIGPCINYTNRPLFSFSTPPSTTSPTNIQPHKALWEWQTPIWFSFKCAFIVAPMFCSLFSSTNYCISSCCSTPFTYEKIITFSSFSTF